MTDARLCGRECKRAVRERVDGTIKWTVEKIDPIRDWINLILTAWPEPSQNNSEL
jgi:hypothetical protein